MDDLFTLVVVAGVGVSVIWLIAGLLNRVPLKRKLREARAALDRAEGRKRELYQKLNGTATEADRKKITELLRQEKEASGRLRNACHQIRDRYDKAHGNFARHQRIRERENQKLRELRDKKGKAKDKLRRLSDEIRRWREELNRRVAAAGRKEDVSELGSRVRDAKCRIASIEDLIERTQRDLDTLENRIEEQKKIVERETREQGRLKGTLYG